MKLKKEDQSVNSSVILRRWNKILMGGITETKCRAETERKAIQRLPHLGIHLIYRHQTQTLLQMPRSACQQEPDIAVSWETLPNTELECLHQTIGLSTGSTVEEFEKDWRSWRGLQPHRNNHNINQPEPPELSGTKPPTKDYTWRDPWLQPHM